MSDEVKKILASDKNRTIRNLNATDLRELLTNFGGGDATMMSSCEDMFNVQNGDVLLYVGDNFAVANMVCPTGSNFYILPGTHIEQSVGYSKNGNMWTAYTSAIMDGQGNVGTAFDQGLNNNTISLFTIKNYNVYGIISTSGTENVDIIFMTFENIAPNASSGPHDPGQENSAVYFEDTENLYIRYSNFEDVASGVRIRFSDGPLKILDNEALNSGRNFFQCDQCYGGNIRINGNSLDRTSSYGNSVLEDWISIFKSEGLSTDPIQVNNNRARGHSGSGFGSFIMLGDYGGKHQEAVGNIGVNPGQVGIGAHGGEYIYVADNKMYSEGWFDTQTQQGSNVAFSSYKADDTQAPCSNHDFENNTANWFCGDPVHCSPDPPPAVLNNAWAIDDCDLSYNEINNETTHDQYMDENVWNEW